MLWKKISDEIEKYEPVNLNSLLKCFYAEVKNEQGEDYEPDNLKVTITSLDRHLEQRGYTFFIARDKEFTTSKQVLEGKVSWCEKVAEGRDQIKHDSYHKRKKLPFGKKKNSASKHQRHSYKQCDGYLRSTLVFKARTPPNENGRLQHCSSGQWRRVHTIQRRTNEDQSRRCKLQASKFLTTNVSNWRTEMSSRFISRVLKHGASA